MRDKDRHHDGPPPSRILTLAEAAEILHTSYSTVYRLVTEGELDAFRLCYALGAKNELFMPVDVARRLADLNMRTMDGHLRL